MATHLQLNNTISTENCNTYRRQNNLKNTLTVKLWLGAFRPFPFVGSPPAGARDEIAPGPQGCVIMGVPCHYLIDERMHP